MTRVLPRANAPRSRRRRRGPAPWMAMRLRCGVCQGERTTPPAETARCLKRGWPPCCGLPMEPTAPVLTAEQAQLAGDNYRLVFMAVNQLWRRSGIRFWYDDRDEAVSVGYWALCWAAINFDASLGWKFSTYATNVIMRHVCRGDSSVIAIPFHVRDDLVRVSKGQKPNHPRLAAAGERVAHVAHLEASSHSEAGSSWLIDDGAGPDQEAERLERDARLAALLRRLPPRYRQVIQLRFGLTGPPRTLEACGRMLRVSKERIRQIEALAMARLQEVAAASKMGGAAGEI